jgi:hypothetical protein
MINKLVDSISEQHNQAVEKVLSETIKAMPGVADVSTANERRPGRALAKTYVCVEGQPKWRITTTLNGLKATTYVDQVTKFDGA